jgi:peptide/nickel transport system ATP-binding protein
VSLLAANHVSKSYDGQEAVADISFALESGTALGVIGESGSGKSTLARLIAGLEEPDAGSIVLEGREVGARRTRDERRKVQIIFQDALAALNPRLTVLESVEDFLAIHHPGSRRERRQLAIEALEEVQLRESVGRRRPAQLSGGQRQRVCVARALAVSPSVLVADEPTSALDVSIQGQILNLLVELKRERRLALIFISHDMGVIRFVADHVLVMLDGRVVESGPRSVVIDSPTHEYTQMLVRAATEVI